MKTILKKGIVGLSLILTSNLIMAHGGGDNTDVDLHVNPDIDLCDFDIHSSLTQTEWKRFTKEGGNLIFLNPLSSAKPLGFKKWDLFIESTASDVDATIGAWNNTFHHPDEEHYLNDNGRTAVPAMRFRIGLSNKLDAGLYYTTTKPMGANYGFFGLEAKYSFINDTVKNWAASVRASYVTDANIQDFNLSVMGIDFSVSKSFWKVLTPYTGVAINYNYTKEVTDEVDLSNENYVGVRGVIGAEFRWKFVNLGIESMFGDGFNNRAIKIGVTF